MMRVHLTLTLTTCNRLPQISGGVKAARVKQVMADMALNNVSNRGVEDLTASEYKRLVIGVQLMRDPGQCRAEAARGLSHLWYEVVLERCQICSWITSWTSLTLFSCLFSS